MSTRNLTTAVAGIALAGLLAIPALAADYPSGPIRLIVPFSSGDAVDATARVFAERMKRDLKAAVIVQNIPGAGGGKGTIEAAKTKADGHTLLVGSTGALTARPLMSTSGYKTADFVPLAQLVEVPIGLAVRSASPYKTLGQLLDDAKANPGKVKYATPAPGTTQHINMEKYAHGAGLKLVHIGGKGGKGAVTKALTGEVDFVFVGASNYTALVKAGKLRVLGIANDKRVAYLPDAPTFKEQGVDLKVAVWFGLLTRTGTPKPVIDKLTAIIDDVANNPKTIELYRKLNLEPAFENAAKFQKTVDDTVASNKIVLKQVGLIN